MNKKKQILIISFLLFLLMIIIYNYPSLLQKKEDTIEPKNGALSIYLQNGSGNDSYYLSNDRSWPTVGYVYNEEKSYCDNDGEISYNHSTNKVAIVTNKTEKCYAYFDMIPLTEYLTTLASTDSTNFASDHSNIRYIGANPNNYITFNNETWRIMGVFDGKVKIIRTTPYNNTPYTFYDGDASGTNNKFQNAAIKTELNEAFYQTINSTYRSMIKEGTWNVGGLNSWDYQVAGTAYNNEKSTTITANIGLISTTDYVYAIGGSNRNTCIGSTHIGDVDSCKSDNWLYPYATTSNMWTINEYTPDSSYALVVTTAGKIAPNGIQYTAAVYPVLYLHENVGFTSGDGTESNPFKPKEGSQTIISNNYKDYITNVYVDTWGNGLPGFAEKSITSFDKENGAFLFANDTWGIPSEYTIDQITVYSDAGTELTTYYQRTWLEDYEDNRHARLSNYEFKRQIAPDLDYIGGSEVLEQNNGRLRFVIIVKS